VMKSDNHCLVVLLPLLTNGGSALIVRLFAVVYLCLPTSAQAAGHGVRSCTKNANIIGLHQLLIVNADLHGREYHLRDTHDEYLPQGCISKLLADLFNISALSSVSQSVSVTEASRQGWSRLTYPAVTCVSLVFVKFGIRKTGRSKANALRKHSSA
jgi:hypothetical protein